MIVTLLKPHFEGTFIKHNIANVPGRGLSYGNLLLKHWSQQKGTKYVLKMDIRKFYPNINISILVNKLKTKVRDVKLIGLIELLLYTESPNGIGVSLGSYLNLWLALFFLDDLDHILKEQFKVKFYLRYVDDMLILTKTKKEAKNLLRFIEKYLSDIKLEIKETGRGKAKIYKWTDDRFIDMLGTKTYRNKQVLRSHVYLNINRQIRKVKKDGKDPHLARSVLSYKGIAQYSDCRNLYSSIETVIEKYNLKKVASL